MSHEFVRSIKDIRDISKQPRRTNLQNDLLSVKDVNEDGFYPVFVRSKDKYIEITGGGRVVHEDGTITNGTGSGSGGSTGNDSNGTLLHVSKIFSDTELQEKVKIAELKQDGLTIEFFAIYEDYVTNIYIRVDDKDDENMPSSDGGSISLRVSTDRTNKSFEPYSYATRYIYAGQNDYMYEQLSVVRIKQTPNNPYSIVEILNHVDMNISFYCKPTDMTQSSFILMLKIF